MARSFFRQATQIRQSDVYDDTLAAGATLESAAATIEDDLNSIRSQLKRWLRADAAGNWYEDVPTFNGKKRAIAALNLDLDDLEEKRLLFRSQVLTDITVPFGQNYVVLSFAGSQTPSVAAAVDAGTAEGAVVATLSGDVGAHYLNTVSGATAISPKNLLIIRDATTGQPIQDSDNKDIYGLLQTETGVVDGNTFNDSNHQAQISFVKENATGDALVACNTAAIQSKVINYAYAQRVKFDNVPETAFLSGIFLDQTVVSSDVTLNNAIDNQVGPATQTDRDIDWRITDTFKLIFQTSDGGRDLLALMPNAAGDVVQLNLDTLDINNVNPADFLGAIEVATGGTKIRVGTVSGQVDSAAALTLKSQAGGDMTHDAAGEHLFTDGNRGASTFGTSMKFSDTAAEWSDFETAFGEVSLLRSIVLAKKKENRTKSVARVTGTINADVNVTGAGGTPNIDAQLADYSSASFMNDVDVYLNGELMRNGADASANHDVYPGTSAANGDLKFEFKLKAGDQIHLIVWGEPG